MKRIHGRTALAAAVLVGVAVLVGWNGSLRGEDDPPVEQAVTPPGEAMPSDELDQLFVLAEGIYSSAQPEDEAAFAVLDELGVKTIISVDGSAPDIELARQHGMRYVHLPIGYDGIDHEQALRIVQAAEQLPGPVLIHCHHGKHRGPAAAAIVCRAKLGWSGEEAHAWLEQAGTSPDYSGLFATVEAFEPPTADELAALPADFPERAEIGDLQAAMVEVDRYFDHLKLARTAEFGVPTEHPDIDPPHEALQLSEQFREILRLDTTPARGEEFVRLTTEGAEHAEAFSQLLRVEATERDAAWQEQAELVFGQMRANCTECHHAYRDVIEP